MVAEVTVKVTEYSDVKVMVDCEAFLVRVSHVTFQLS